MIIWYYLGGNHQFVKSTQAYSSRVDISLVEKRPTYFGSSSIAYHGFPWFETDSVWKNKVQSEPPLWWNTRSSNDVHSFGCKRHHLWLKLVEFYVYNCIIYIYICMYIFAEFVVAICCNVAMFLFITSSYWWLWSVAEPGCSLTIRFGGLMFGRSQTI